MPYSTAELEKLTLTADYHTHTVFSHGTGTIEENVIEAMAKNLKSIAITDHGFRHWMIAISPADIPKMRAEVERLRKLYPIEILLGIEANLISLNGDLDLSEEQAKLFDILIFGAHFTAKPKTLKACFGWWLGNVFCRTKAQREKNTQAYIKAIRRYKPKIVVHLNHMVRVNCAELARVAAECGTLIELNAKRTIFSEEEVKDMLATNVNFVISSDAHSADRVGEFSHVKKFLANHYIPLNRIVNIKQE